MNDVLVFGAFGDLGSELVMQGLRLSKGVSPLGRKAGDVRDTAWVRKMIRSRKPSLVVNATAYHKVDEAESNSDECFAVNAEAVRGMAEACVETGATFLHFSSDYVFNGRVMYPYTEEDSPDPVNNYGKSKLAGEMAIREAGGRWVIVRTSALFGSLHGVSSKGGDFVKRILARAKKGDPLEVVEDVVFSPSYVAYVAKTAMQIIEAGLEGVFHVVNQGAVSWADYTQEIIDIAGWSVDVMRIKAADLEAKGAVRRPRYSALASVHLSSPPYRPMLEEYVKRLAR